MNDLYRARIWTLVWAAAVWLVLVLPVPGGTSEALRFLPGWLAADADKVAHALLFAPLGFWLPATRFRAGSPAASLIRTLAECGGFGLLTELSQLALRQRAAEVGDLAADLAGAAVGWWLRAQLDRRALESEGAGSHQAG